MEARARLFGHPVHQMLVVFPLGLLATSVVFDVLAMVSDANGHTFGVVAYWMLLSGLVGGALAAVFGWIDWSSIPAGTRARRLGLAHGLGNVLVLGCFLVSWWLRLDDGTLPAIVAYVFSFSGLLVALMTAWMGGELVSRLGMGVSPGANLNAPSSLAVRSLDADDPARRDG